MLSERCLHLKAAFKMRLTIYWAVPITTSEQALISVNRETFMVWRCSERFDGMASAKTLL